MISINAKILDQIFISNKTEIDTIISEIKSNVENYLASPSYTLKRSMKPFDLTTQQQKYLEYLISKFEPIIFSHRPDLKTHQTKFDSIITPRDMKSKLNRKFRNELLLRMRYAELRSSFYPEYFNKIGIKACVFCNSQLAVTVTKTGNQRVAKFQVDHHRPKSEYPCFSISFYNLYPSCGPCNGSKSARSKVVFDLYSHDYKDYKESKYKFVLDKKSLVKYRVNGINAELQIRFSDSDFNDIFAIEGIYETQKDVAEELVLKSMIYSKTYRDSLRKSLSKLYKDKSPALDRLIVGNYTEERDIHKRPLAKFTQDIAKQLGLI